MIIVVLLYTIVWTSQVHGELPVGLSIYIYIYI